MPMRTASRICNSQLLLGSLGSYATWQAGIVGDYWATDRMTSRDLGMQVRLDCDEANIGHESSMSHPGLIGVPTLPVSVHLMLG